MLESLLNKSCRPESLQLYQKETPTTVFSYKIFETCKNTYLEEHLRMTASAYSAESCLGPCQSFMMEPQNKICLRIYRKAV